MSLRLNLNSSCSNVSARRMSRRSRQQIRFSFQTANRSSTVVARKPDAVADFGSTTDTSGLDHPPSRVMTTESVAPQSSSRQNSAFPRR